MAELAGVYRYVGAGGTVKRPTKEGPAMVFNNVKGHKDARVAIGVLASRKRVAALLDCKPEELGKKLYHSVDNPIAPVEYQGDAPCQQVVHKVEDPDFNLYDLVPAPTNTPDDAGPYITLGMCYATHPDTGVHDVTIHRLCIQGKDELSIFFTPGARHIGAMAERAEELGQKLPFVSFFLICLFLISDDIIPMFKYCFSYLRIIHLPKIFLNFLITKISIICLSIAAIR